MSLVALGLLAASAPAAEEEPAVVFVETSTLNTSCADLAAGKVRVPIRNETAVERKVSFALQLSNENGGVAGSVCGSITATVKEGGADSSAEAGMTLGPGEAKTILLTAAEDADAREVTGSMVLLGGEGRVARRDVAIATPASGRNLAATPLDSSVSEEFEGLDGGKVWVPIEGELPDDGEGTKAITVGALSGRGGPVAVVYRGHTAPVDDGVSKLALELEGGLEPGTYSGKVDLDPADEEKGGVDLEIKVSESWEKAALLLLLGIAVGTALLAISGRVLPSTRLRGQVAALGTRHAKAVDALEVEEDGGRGWNRFQIGDIGKRQEALEEQIDEAMGKVVVQVEESVVKNIETAIAQLEVQIDLLKEIPRQARALESALLLPRAVLAPDDNAALGDRPKLDQKAEDALKGGPLKGDALKPRIDEMEALAKLLRDLRRAEGWLEELWRKLPKEGAPALRERLEACRDRLSRLEDAEGLQLATDELREAWKELLALPAASMAAGPEALSRLAAGAKGREEMPTEEVSQLTAEVITSQQASTPSPVTMAATAPPSDAPQPAAQPPESPLDPAQATKAINRAFLIQCGVVVISALVALATGLGLLYAGKTWGTDWDYLAAIIWGIGAQATVSKLTTSLDQLGSLSWLRRGI